MQVPAYGVEFAGGTPKTKDQKNYQERSITNNAPKLRPEDYGLGGMLWDFDRIARTSRLRFGRSWSNFDDLVSYYDVARMPDIDGATMPLVGHIFFTRPSLNIAVNGEDALGSANYAEMCAGSSTASWARDYHGRRLLQMMSEYSRSYYMPLFTNRAMSYVVGDMNINVIEKGHTFFGHFIKYGATTQEYRTAGTLSMEFRNDVYQSVIKAIALWIQYIASVAFSENIKPCWKYESNGILDYAASIYYLVTKMDMSTLVYWEKLTGVFPKNVPLSVFSYSDNVIMEDKLSIDFEYAIRSDPCDPNVLFDLNMLTGNTYSAASHYFQFGATNQQGGPQYHDNMARTAIVLPRDFEGPIGLGNAYAHAPIVQLKINSDGTYTYLLQYVRTP